MELRLIISSIRYRDHINKLTSSDILSAEEERDLLCEPCTNCNNPECFGPGDLCLTDDEWFDITP